MVEVEITTLNENESLAVPREEGDGTRIISPIEACQLFFYAAWAWKLEGAKLELLLARKLNR